MVHAKMNTMPDTRYSSSRKITGKLLIFDTHPIQYRSPVFRLVHERLDQLKVWFFNESFDGNRWWFHEVGKIPQQKWALPLREGFSSEVIGTDELGFWRSLRQIKSILKSESPSAVVIYGYYLPEHWIIRRLTARMSIPLIFVGETFSGSGSFIRRLFKKSLIKYFFQGVSQFVTIGSKTSSFYRSFNVEPSRMIDAKYCTDVNFFSLSKIEARGVRERWRTRLQIPQDAFVLLFVGRLFERKRPADMLEIHQKLSDVPFVHTVIVGNGPLERDLQISAQRLSRVHLLGFRNQAETKECYHGADLLIVPSEYETWGLVINEAFAAGTPAIVTETCGAAGDLVIPGHTGYTFPKGNVEEAVRLIRRLISDCTLRAQLSENARVKITREFSLDQFASALLEALTRVQTKH